VVGHDGGQGLPAGLADGPAVGQHLQALLQGGLAGQHDPAEARRLHGAQAAGLARGQDAVPAQARDAEVGGDGLEKRLASQADDWHAI
jgi:hypothetical protein